MIGRARMSWAALLVGLCVMKGPVRSLNYNGATPRGVGPVVVVVRAGLSKGVAVLHLIFKITRSEVGWIAGGGVRIGLNPVRDAVFVTVGPSNGSAGLNCEGGGQETVGADLDEAR